jgi:ribosomal protein S14
MIHYLNFKDYKYRKLVVRGEFFKTISYSCIFDTRISFKSRFFFKTKLSDRILLLSRCNITKVRARCKETGRSRFIVSYIGLSRAQFKRRVSFGFLSGFKKK